MGYTELAHCDPKTTEQTFLPGDVVLLKKGVARVVTNLSYEDVVRRSLPDVFNLTIIWERVKETCEGVVWDVIEDDLHRIYAIHVGGKPQMFNFTEGIVLVHREPHPVSEVPDPK